jgi:hypothetical protein
LGSGTEATHHVVLRFEEPNRPDFEGFAFYLNVQVNASCFELSAVRPRNGHGVKFVRHPRAFDPNSFEAAVITTARTKTPAIRTEKAPTIESIM